MSANSTEMVNTNLEQNVNKNIQSSARNSSSVSFATTKMAGTVSAARFTPMHAEPPSEQKIAVLKNAGFSTSEVPKTPSNSLCYCVTV